MCEDSVIVGCTVSFKTGTSNLHNSVDH